MINKFCGPCPAPGDTGFFENEEGRREFAEWKARQQAEQQKQITTGWNIRNDAPVCSVRAAFLGSCGMIKFK